MGRFHLAVLIALAVAGCANSPLEPLNIPDGCNPLASEWDCLLPFPSDYFLVRDDALPSGSRVELPDLALVTMNGHLANPLVRHPADGFSHLSQIVALFPMGVDPSNLVFHTDGLEPSLVLSSPTLLIDAERKQLVAHFAELDPLATTKKRCGLVIRPLVRLKNNNRYLVAIHGLKDLNGTLISAPKGFSRIRDEQGEGHAVLEDLAKRFEKEIFPVLEEIGIDRGELQLAWDFSTESEKHVTSDMLAVRSQTIENMESLPPQVSVTEVFNDVDSHIFRQIEGSFNAPLFLKSTEPGAQLNRAENGAITINGETQVKFTLLIPRSVAARSPEDPPARVLQYGHGFFNSRNNPQEIGYISPFLDRYQFVYLATDWWGLCQDDLNLMMEAILERPSEILAMTDRVHQAMANFIALIYAAKGPLLEQPSVQVNGKAVYDPEQMYYYGVSMGHILGGSYLALSPHIERAVLSVGGAGFTFMMTRSFAFHFLLDIVMSVVRDSLDVQKYLVLSQTVFDRIDPVTYAAHVIQEKYPQSPSSRVILMQIGIGDSYMPNLASHLHARELGLGLLQPSPRELEGLRPLYPPTMDSTMVEFDFGYEPPLPGTVAIPPADSNGIHQQVRQLDPAMRQIDSFLKNAGRIEYTCEGICDPE